MNKFIAIFFAAALVCGSSHAQTCKTPNHVWTYDSTTKRLRSVDRQTVEMMKYSADFKRIEIPEGSASTQEGLAEAIAYFEKTPETRVQAALLREAGGRFDTYSFIVDGVPTVLSVTDVSIYKKYDLGQRFMGDVGFLMYKFMGKPVYFPCNGDA
jgi:hypothetical protein